MVKYSFTVNTDASYNQHHNIAAWAYWVKSDHYSFKRSGVFPHLVRNNAVAELLAIELALLAVKELVAKDEFLKHFDEISVHINCDSLWAVHAVTQTIKRTKHRSSVNRVKALADEFKVTARHIKAHTRSADISSEANEWCDERSRAILRIKIQGIKELLNG